jgi:phosphatidylserine/phosphatidylglycerophosphate/cardiolipin synthase-like enzyme
MRSRSRLVGGFKVFAVAGTNTVSFGISASKPARKGLLGFAIERVDPASSERFYMRGFKVFPSLVPDVTVNLIVSTYEHPIQSFVWDDFTAEPGHLYTYVFHPLRGTPKNLDRTATPISIDVNTEPLYGQHHNVFFNRGVASSQAYAHWFRNLSPDAQRTPEERRQALNWLSRDLDDAMIRFIRSARKGEALRGAFYEFTYEPVIAELAAAIRRGVDVKLVIDFKVNAYTSKEKQPDGSITSVVHPSAPRDANKTAIKQAKLPDAAIIRREARPSSLAHNKFMVLLTGRRRTPAAVWTGSTNLTLGGIHGQANVGHWVNDSTTAETFLRYWDLLNADSGGTADDSPSVVRQKNAAYVAAVDTLTPTPTDVSSIETGTTAIFSPRRDMSALDLYAQLVDGAEHMACITIAFNFANIFKTALADNDTRGPLVFVLLESEDKPNARAKDPYVRLNAKNNVYEAFGSEIDTPLGRWIVEINNFKTKLNAHVAFMHCKFLLHDPLGSDPIVVSGSANFSKSSTTDNDENMLIIRGDRRVADIYFTEFNRLFNHYYFRSVIERTTRRRGFVGGGESPGEGAPSVELAEDDSWLVKYAAGTLRSKRVAAFVGMR